MPKLRLIPHRRLIACAAVLGLAAALWLPAAAVASQDAPAHHDQSITPFPTTIRLPDGFRPEGIAIGALPLAYFGSLANGDIYRANLLTGQGQVISPGPGTQSVGLALDRRGRLFVAGGTAGDARVVDVATGTVLASYPLATGSTFINDVIVTHDAAWFTDSFQPVLYRVPLGRQGQLPTADQVTAVPLTGDFVQTPGQNANGIERTPDGAGLLVMQNSTARLFRVDPATGVAIEVDLAGQTLPAGDGLLLRGHTLYVVQNLLNQVSVVRLDASGDRGTVTGQVTDPDFDLPTTVAAFGGRLYLPNFGPLQPTPDTPYTAVAIRRP
jgi:sugar lactone lactonase YvrE